MRLARLSPPPRFLALAFALILAFAASSIVTFFPAMAQAACSYDFTWRVYYYSDPGLTQYVGQCVHTCDGQTTCTGEQTDYSQIVHFSRCPYPTCV